MNYQEYLESDHWKHLKLKKAERTKLCFICKRTPDTRNFHHVRYKELFDVTVNDIRLACEDCHHFYHAFKKENPTWKEKWVLKYVRKMVKALNKQ